MIILEKVKIHLVLICWCCNEKEETTTHVFLKSSLANKLWRQFADFAGTQIEGMHIQQLIIAWWKFKSSPQLLEVMTAMPTIIMWTMWKRINIYKAWRKH